MTSFSTSSTSPVNSGVLRRSGRRAADRAPIGTRLGPSPFGHRSFAEEMLGLPELRAARTTKTPRPGAGTRAVVDPRTVCSPRAFISPRVVTDPRVYSDPRGTTAIRSAVR